MYAIHRIGHGEYTQQVVGPICDLKLNISLWNCLVYSRHGPGHQDNLALYLAIIAAALLTGTADAVVVHRPVGAALAARDERLLYGCHVTVDALGEHIAQLFYAQFDEGGRVQQSVLDIECQQSAVGSVDDLLAVNLEKGVCVSARWRACNT